MILFCEGKAFPGRIEDKGWEIQSDDEETVVLFLLRDLWEKCNLVKSEEYQTWDPAEENSIGKKCFSSVSASEIHVLGDSSLTVAGWHFPYSMFLTKTLNLPLKSPSHRGRALLYQSYAGVTVLKFRSLWWCISLKRLNLCWGRLSSVRCRLFPGHTWAKTFPISFARILLVFVSSIPVHSSFVGKQEGEHSFNLYKTSC